MLNGHPEAQVTISKQTLKQAAVNGDISLIPMVIHVDIGGA